MPSKQDLIEKAEEEVRAFAIPPSEVKPEDVGYTEKLGCMVAIQTELDKIPLTAEQVSALMNVPNLLFAIEGEWSAVRNKTVSDVVADYLPRAVAEYRALRLYEKADKEYKDRVEEVKKLTPDEIVRAAYELVMKENLLTMLQEKGIPEEQVDVLLATEYSLDALYQEWLGNDLSFVDMLQETMVDFVEKEKECLLRSFLAGESVPEPMRERLEAMTAPDLNSMKAHEADAWLDTSMEP